MIAFSIGPLNIYWYGIFYAVSFILGYLYIKLLLKEFNILPNINKDNFLDDLLFYIVLGVLIGGRLGYVFFYNFSYFLKYPWKVFFVWEGGMAFVGAFIGVGLSLYLLSKKYKISLFRVTDLIVSFLPFGLGLGRIGNYLNGELFGKSCPTFLSGTFLCKDYGLGGLNISNQLIESFFEGWLLFFIFQFLVWRYKILQKDGFLTIFFVLYYSVIRFILEFVRWHPKDYILYIGLSISQFFMIMFFIFGVFLLLFKLRK